MNRPKVLTAAVALAAAATLTSPARATQTVSCAALDGSGVAVEINVGHAAVEAPVWIRIQAGDEPWSSLPKDRADDPRTVPVVIAQSFFDEGGMTIDVADENSEAVVASIRVARVRENDETFQFGHIHLPGRSVHPLTCDGA